MAIDRDRLVRQFVELTAIDSLSLRERTMADYIIKTFDEMGISLKEDDSAGRIGGNAGNLHGIWKGEGEKEAGMLPILFAAHMDTVEPGIGKKAVLHEGGLITSDGTTVLGADDMAAVAVYIEALRSIRDEGKKHRPVEFLFTVAEEMHTRGSSAFDCSKLISKEAYVLDCSDVIGSYSAQEPTLIDFTFVIKGRAAHAGFEPDKGINAIEIAAKAISRIQQGWISEGGNLNIGKIEGGIATNVVSPEVTVRGELRMEEHEKALETFSQTYEVFREQAERTGGSVDEEHNIKLFAYKIGEDEPALIRYKKILEDRGITPNVKRSFGGSDNNVLKRNGIRGVCLYNPMHDIHTTDEYTTVDELVTMAGIVEELMCRE